MLRTLEAVIDNQNHVQWLEPIQFNSPQRVLITLLDSSPITDETLLMSEPALEEWLNDEEEAAWAHLQPGA
jgi:hypothetical protein